MRYPLVAMQGNNGNINGDGSAASRYTETKLSPIGEALLTNTSSDTVKFVDNYDNTTMEPTALAGTFPNFLCNGNEGIAVGMSCSILPHNLSEVVDGIIAYIKNRAITLPILMKYIQGPDFPMGGIVTERDKLLDAYTTGRGTINLRAKYEIDKRTNSITFSEFPYLVDVETKIIAAIKKLVADGNPDIEDYENHIGKNSCHIKVLLNKRADPERVAKLLFAKTPLAKRVRINHTFIKNGVPIEMGLLEMIAHYVLTQHQIMVRIATKEQLKQENIAHINEGLLKAVHSIDKVIAIVRGSDTKLIAQNTLIEQLGLTVKQAEAVLGLQLGRLTRLDVNDIEGKIQKAKEEAAYQHTVRTDNKVRDTLLIEELSSLKAKFGDARRTMLINEIAEEEEVVSGPTKGVFVVFDDGTTTLEHEDDIGGLFKKGSPFVKRKPITAFWTNAKPYGVSREGIVVPQFNELIWKRREDAEYLVTITNKGTVKRTALSEYGKVRNKGKLCKLRKDEFVVAVFEAKEDDNILFTHSDGRLSQYPLSAFPSSSKLTVGTKGPKHEVVNAISGNTAHIYTVNAEGQIKRTESNELSTTAVQCGDPIFAGYTVRSYFYDTGAIFPVDWESVKVLSRNAAGARLNNKVVKWIG